MPRTIENAATITRWIDELIMHLEAGKRSQLELCADLLLEDFENLTRLTPLPNKTSSHARVVYPAELVGFDIGRVRKVARAVQRGRSAIAMEQMENALASFREARRLWVGK